MRRSSGDSWLPHMSEVPLSRSAHTARSILRLCLGALCLATYFCRADEFVIDQHYDGDSSGIVSVHLIGPFTPATTFTPALSSLDFVDLVTQSQGSSFADLQAAILRDSTAIAYSDLLRVTNSASATNRFWFYPTVGLTPGTNYQIQVRTIDNSWSALGRGSLFFTEGRVIPAQVPPPLTIRSSFADVCWSSRTNTTYQVQFRSDLTTNVWVDLGPPTTGNGLVNCVTDAIAGPQKFYRVKVLQ